MNSRLSLTDYSNKYKVSISTLRRRIRAQQVDFVYQDGKYFLKDSPLDGHVSTSPGFASHKIAPPQLDQANFVEDKQTSVVTPGTVMGQPNVNFGELLDEIKAAYRTALQEQEEQILLLKDEVADLRTLVRVLESENERLKLNLESRTPIESWLEDLSVADGPEK